MVKVKREVELVIADLTPVSSVNALNPSSIDRRMKAMKSCSYWNNALLNGRRSRGPQWDYATASYHVSKNSSEYYKGVTRLELPNNSSNQTSSSNMHNHSGPSTSSKIPFNVQNLDRHPHQIYSDPFSNRSIKNNSQTNSNHHRSLVNSISSPFNYPIHPQTVGNHVSIPVQSFNQLQNHPIIPSHQVDSQSEIFSPHTSGMVNPSNPVATSSNVLSSPHFQYGVPPNTNHGITRQMSTTPSLPSSQTERKDVAVLSHQASYPNSGSSNQHSMEPPTSRMVSLPQSFSPDQYHPLPSSFDKTVGEGMASTTHPQALRSPAHHGLEPQITSSNRKFHSIPSNSSLHTLSQRPLTPRSAQTLNPAGALNNPTQQVFQPMHVGYPSPGTGGPPMTISSQVRNLQYNQPSPNSNIKPHVTGQQQISQIPNLSSQDTLTNEPNQFSSLSSFQSQPPALFNNPTPSTFMNNHSYPMTTNAMIGRPIPPNLNAAQYQCTMIPSENSSAPHLNPYSSAAARQKNAS